MIMKVNKNHLLMSTFLISQIPTIFYGMDLKVDWYLLVDKTKRIGMVTYYWGVSLNFLIMAYCLHYPTGISKKVSKFILIITMLDLIHLLANGKQGWGFAKVVIAIIIYYGSNRLNNGSTKSTI